MIEWHSTKDRPNPPAHTKLVFVCDNNKVYAGDMCYGLHEAWFCIHYLNGETQVLRDHNINVLRWCTWDEFVKGLPNA